MGFVVGNEAKGHEVKSEWTDASRGSYEEARMFTRMLIPLDGSKTAEKVLPYARFVASALKLPVELLGVVDIAEMATHITAARASHLDSVIEDSVRYSQQYLRGVADTFPVVDTKCTVEKGKPEQLIIETAAARQRSRVVRRPAGLPCSPRLRPMSPPATVESVSRNAISAQLS